MNRQRTLVLFDAVGTVIKPDPDVDSVYQMLGMLHGSSLSRDEIKQRISAARQRHFNVGMSAKTLFADATEELESSDEVERRLWQQLVCDVFSDLDQPETLFEDLWTHFAQSVSWEVYPDVADCWKTLRQRGFEIGIASNFDSRLIRILDGHPETADVDYAFCSAQVGFRKPSPLFYRQIEAAVTCTNPDLASVPQFVMVGDDFENDCVAPKLAGWSAVWLNRKHHQRDQRTNPVSSSANEVVSLAEFTEWVVATID